jgi:hypothetical protein
MNIPSIIYLSLLILASSRANAALLGFEANQGYSLNNISNVDDSIIYENAGFDGTVGPEVHTYSAGDGNSLHTDVIDNTGKFRNISGAGRTGDFLTERVDLTYEGDTTYLATHSTRQTNNSVRPAGYNAGTQVLAIRADAKPFDTAAQDGPHTAKYAYTVDSIDLNGISPTAVGDNIITIDFYTCVSAHETTDAGGVILSTTDNDDFRSLEMGFGGSLGNSAQIGWTDENNLAYFNGASWVDTGLLFNYRGYDGVSLSINTAADTWSLSISRSLNSSSAYAIENVFSNQPLFTPLGSNFGDITFSTYEDQDDGTAATKNGLVKTYFDNFAFTVVPEPSAALLGLLGCLGFLRRRR